MKNIKIERNKSNKHEISDDEYFKRAQIESSLFSSSSSSVNNELSVINKNLNSGTYINELSLNFINNQSVLNEKSNMKTYNNEFSLWSDSSDVSNSVLDLKNRCVDTNVNEKKNIDKEMPCLLYNF
jgi:hypothetical protein